ncbi:MAG: type II toxin-antitoxin system RelE/ParE family toxin [Acidimicrobiia bacterium]
MTLITTQRSVPTPISLLLLSDPGSAVLPEFPTSTREGLWSARRGTYRILYRIDDDHHEVIVLRVGRRHNVIATKSNSWSPP